MDGRRFPHMISQLSVDIARAKVIQVMLLLTLRGNAIFLIENKL